MYFGFCTCEPGTVSIPDAWNCREDRVTHIQSLEGGRAWCPQIPTAEGGGKRGHLLRRAARGAGRRHAAELSVCLPQAHPSVSHRKEVSALLTDKPYTQVAFLPSQRAVSHTHQHNWNSMWLGKMVMQVHGKQCIFVQSTDYQMRPGLNWGTDPKNGLIET